MLSQQCRLQNILGISPFVAGLKPKELHGIVLKDFLFSLISYFHTHELLFSKLQAESVGAKHDFIPTSAAVHKCYDFSGQILRVIGRDIAIDIWVPEDHGAPFVYSRVASVRKVNLQVGKMYGYFINFHWVTSPAGQRFS